MIFVTKNQVIFTNNYYNSLGSFLRVMRAGIGKYFLADCSSYCGRPEVPFNDCSDRSKRRKTQDLLVKNSTETLSYATSMALRKSGNEYAALKCCN